MGWRNLFIKLGDENTYNTTDLTTLNKFINHHNNWLYYFDEDEIVQMYEDDTIPGETIIPTFLSKKNKENVTEYWSVVGNNGGSAWTESWVEQYFPKIRMFNSSTWDYYNEDWRNWPIHTLDEITEIFK